MTSPAPYLALALQTRCEAVNRSADVASARDLMLRSIARIGAQIAASKRFIGPDLRLVCLPEYVLTGFPMGDAAAAWSAKAALSVDGPEYEALGAVARASDIWLAGNAYEQDAHFPGLYFQTAFVVEPAGGVILRYRRLISMFSPSPYDVFDRYVSVHGREALFPVAETELGRIAAVASEEILYPEIARAFALRGAEVLVHSSSEAGSLLPTHKTIARQARAIENLAYVVSANTAGIEGIDIPMSSTDGRSAIVDYRGAVMAEAGFGESMVAHAEIDVAALRRWRRRPGMGNLLARQPVGLWREAYAVDERRPPNGLLSDDAPNVAIAPDAAWYARRQAEVIRKLSDDGLI